MGKIWGWPAVGTGANLKSNYNEILVFAVSLNHMFRHGFRESLPI